MDAHIFRRLCNYLSSWLPGARIEKIQAPYRDHLSITFYKAGSKRHLICRFGRKDPFCFISDKRPEAEPRPTAAIMRLRKHAANRHVQAVSCDAWQRKLWLLVGGSAGQLLTWICIDMVNGASIHFLEDAPEVLEASWPEGEKLEVALVNWVAWPILTPALRRTLAVLDVSECKALLADLEDGTGDIFLYSDEHGIRKVVAWPLGVLSGNLTEEAQEDFVAGLERAGQDIILKQIFANRNRHLLQAENRRQKHLHKTLAKLEQDEKRLRAMTAREEDAELLAANLWRFEGKEKLANISIESQSQKRCIALDSKLTLCQNMERMFHNIKRGKRGLKLLEERRQKIMAEVAGMEGAARVMSGTIAQQDKTRPGVSSQPKGIQAFWSTDGFLILRGKDARGNQAVRRKAAAHDIWVHVESGPGAHVIIRRQHIGQEVPERTLNEAGNLAANKSWLKDSGTASIMYAEARHVKSCRNGPEGKVTIDKLRETRMVQLERGLEEKLARLD